MKRILSIISIIAMVLSMGTMIAMPAVAEVTEQEPALDFSTVDTRPVNLFDKSTAVVAILTSTGGLNTSNANYYTSDYIAVQPGDTIYLGPCYLGQTTYQFYMFDQNKANPQKVANADLTEEYSFKISGYTKGFYLTSYTIPEGVSYIRATCHKGVADTYLLTKNQPFDNTDHLLQFDALENIYVDLGLGIWTTAGDASALKSTSSHHAADKITVAAGEKVFFGPCNVDQGFQLYFWDAENAATKVTASTAELTVADTFNNGTVIYCYTAPAAGSIGICNATAYNKFFFITKEEIDVDDYYAYCDFHSEAMGDYSSVTKRYANVEVKESVLNGKSALFTGDSICAAAADDDYFNKYFYYNGQTEGANWGGWSGRIAMNYGLERIANNGVSGAALSTTRDTWYNTASTGKKQGRIYWQITKEADYQFDYVVLHGGVNDAWDSAPAGEISDSFNVEDFDPSTYAGGLEATIYYATKYHPEAAIGYILNFASPSNKTGKIATMGEDYFKLGKQICEKWGISYLDLHSMLNEKNFDLTIYANQTKADLIHPNGAGYNVITPYIAAWMETLKPYTTPADTEHDKTVIACVGDSLTKGEQSGDLLRLSYPAYLQEMMGDDYKVVNFGYGGAAVQPSASNTYKETVQYKKSLEADPDQVIIMLGANDAKTANWDTADHAGSCAKFKAALKALVKQYQSLPSKPTVTLVVPPYSSGETRIAIYNDGGMMAAIKALAEELNVKVIDTYVPTSAHPELIASDGTHYTGAGYELIAGTIYEGLTGEAAPAVVPVTEKDTAVAETNEAKPLIRNWKAYYETADAFRIETVEDVEIFGDLIAAGYTFAGKTVYLENDLDFAGLDFMPLGVISGDTPTTETYSYSFAGTFDGQNHVFSNVNIEFYYLGVGLFPVLDGATIKNFGLDGGRVAGHNVVGTITAYGDHGTKLHNIWSSADAYASIRSSASGVGGIASNMRQSGCEVTNVAYYGTVSGVEYVSGLIAYTQNGVNTTENLVFGGTIDLRSKHSGVTPFVRYRTAMMDEAVDGYFMVDTAEQRSVYVDETPVEFKSEAFRNGEFAAYMNAQSETPVWTMKYGYAVPFADENNAAPIAVTKDSVTYYTDYAGDPIGFSLEDGAYWYLNGTLTALNDMPAQFKDGDVLGVAVSKAGADFDNSGSITTADAIMLLRYLDGHKNTGLDDTLADVNADGKARIFDAVRLLQVIRDLPVA